MERAAFLVSASSETDEELAAGAFDRDESYFKTRAKGPRAPQSNSAQLSAFENASRWNLGSSLFGIRCLQIVSTVAAVFILTTILLHVLLREIPNARRLPQPSEAQLELLSTADLERHVRTLASDAFEGRAVGTRGEQKSAAYIAAELLSAGFAPAGDPRRSKSNSTAAYLQRVPLYGFQALPSTAQLTLTRSRNQRATAEQSSASAKASSALQFGADFSLTSERFNIAAIQSQQLESQDIIDGTLSSSWTLDMRENDVVFGGFCISTPRWDDFKATNLSGKVVLCLVNQPRIEGTDGAAVFGGPGAALSYAGRWTAKLEELRRRRAAGVLLLHTDEMAGYGWNVIESGAYAENLQLRGSVSSRKQALLFRGWIRADALEARMAEAGAVQRLIKAACSRHFKPHVLSALKISVSAEIQQRLVTGSNVVGVLRGKNAPEEVVMLTAHHDHLGMRNATRESAAKENAQSGAAVASDETVVYHGALDNAAGVAKLLAIARVLGKLSAEGACCDRSFVVLSPTAEEAVLLGSSHYAEVPSAAPLSAVVGMLNFDGMNVWGKTHDQVALGSQLSSLGEMFAHAVHAEKLVVAHDIMPLQGLFFRSDQLPFARKGVPALKLTHGRRFERAQLLMTAGDDSNDSNSSVPDARLRMSLKDAELKYFEETVGEYEANRYHQSSDSFEYISGLPDPYSGAIQEMRVALRLLYGLLQSRLRPEWNSTEVLANPSR
mmetsp:Transcript_11280/g.30360  ORF Transcript_11280/g.30360 Transcript_11280/m.30360 type:complete len:724 (+) Transcript_11280:320-2491(+)|eukprot:CAMPEP_0185831794 /NCGR_PEP_ID=MMETSP1353-20130828/1708_1 /TAXON_ID=1077150 /ORGANISM="Erythrolobus australicus, Strain CCMP3124" /LENGTH=723 /DNA_ID=CAMNT_0028529903 /DNA_START=218 /DNA_END=2389 /DNA_ORIENTATION=-